MLKGDPSIAYGCAMKLRAFGADLAVTWLNEKAEPYVRPLAEQLQASITAPLDVSKPGELEAVFDTIAKEWGRLDFVSQAMQVSCWSFIRMIKLVEPLMNDGGVMVMMSNYGADKVVNRYNMVGPVKAALEASVRYIAAELGPRGVRGVRVFAVSPGPLKTRASSGISHFDELVQMAQERAPAQRLVDIAEVGRVVAFLVGGASSGMTGDTIYVEGGLHNMA